jgi:hypothetical protein
VQLEEVLLFENSPEHVSLRPPRCLIGTRRVSHELTRKVSLGRRFQSLLADGL